MNLRDLSENKKLTGYVPKMSKMSTCNYLNTGLCYIKSTNCMNNLDKKCTKDDILSTSNGSDKMKENEIEAELDTKESNGDEKDEGNNHFLSMKKIMIIFFVLCLSVVACCFCLSICDNSSKKNPSSVSYVKPTTDVHRNNSRSSKNSDNTNSDDSNSDNTQSNGHGVNVKITITDNSKNNNDDDEEEEEENPYINGSESNKKPYDTNSDITDNDSVEKPYGTISNLNEKPQNAVSSINNNEPGSTNNKISESPMINPQPSSVPEVSNSNASPNPNVAPNPNVNVPNSTYPPNPIYAPISNVGSNPTTEYPGYPPVQPYPLPNQSYPPPPQGYPPQGYPPQGYPPQGYLPYPQYYPGYPPPNQPYPPMYAQGYSPAQASTVIDPQGNSQEEPPSYQDINGNSSSSNEEGKEKEKESNTQLPEKEKEKEN